MRGRRRRAARALRGAAPRRAALTRCGATRCARTSARCASACATSFARAGAGQFDLKQDRGGIADIEFLAQYWALRWASATRLVTYSDTIRQLESLASADLVPQATVDVLTGAYRSYRQRLHHLSLEAEESIVPATEFTAERAAVTAIWDAAFGT